MTKFTHAKYVKIEHIQVRVATTDICTPCATLAGMIRSCEMYYRKYLQIKHLNHCQKTNSTMMMTQTNQQRNLIRGKKLNKIQSQRKPNERIQHLMLLLVIAPYAQGSYSVITMNSCDISTRITRFNRREIADRNDLLLDILVFRATVTKF